jgi:acetylornithine deacetylase/succinyl-diaminopimelate desuccinylase-like protein
MRERCPKNVKIEFAAHGIGGPILTPRDGAAMERARRAVKVGFGIEPVLTRSGGSIPVVAQIKSILGMDTLLVGFGLPDDRVHSPNEKFDLEAFWRGMRTAAALYGELATLKG